MADTNKPEIRDFQSGYLSLPFTQNQLGDFVKSLLGTPQTITKKIRGIFEIHLKDLQNFHELIDQRITQQNKAKLIQLKTQIYYSDESSVILSSYDELLTYNEVKPVLSEAVRMTWSYLIQFLDKDVPEKQEIELMIIATPQKNIIEIEDLPVLRTVSGQFRMVIKHTARRWGADIESLITNQINSILKPTSTFKAFLRKYNILIGFIAGLAFLLSSGISVYISTEAIHQKEIQTAAALTKGPRNDSEKINFLINYVVRNSQDALSSKTQIYLIASFLIAITLGVWVGGLADDKRKSHLVLTRESLKNLGIYNEHSKHKTAWFFISIVISIITGIISSYLFTWLTKP
jgi:hypothetical protein